MIVTKDPCDTRLTAKNVTSCFARDSGGTCFSDWSLRKEDVGRLMRRVVAKPCVPSRFILWQIFFWKDVYLKILSQILHVRFSIMLESELLTPARVARTGLTRKMGYFGMRFLGSELALVGLNVYFLFHGEPKRKRFGLRWVKSHQSFCGSRFNSSVFSTHQSCCSAAEIWVQLTTCWWGYPLRASGS